MLVPSKRECGSGFANRVEDANILAATAFSSAEEQIARLVAKNTAHSAAKEMTSIPELRSWAAANAADEAATLHVVIEARRFSADRN